MMTSLLFVPLRGDRQAEAFCPDALATQGPGGDRQLKGGGSSLLQYHLSPCHAVVEGAQVSR